MGNQIESPVRIFVGADRSQLLPTKVLEYSVRRNTQLTIECHSMADLKLPEPKDPRHRQRTGFSFSRFAIPKVAGYRGRALYLDADMQVFRDIAELWGLPFDGAKVLIQGDLPEEAQAKKPGAPAKRIMQTSVMLLDCGRLSWDANELIAGLDGRYTYEELLYYLCILEPSEIAHTIPFRWNSLEHHAHDTGLVHYTDMATQPWVSPDNRNGYLWLAELRRMLAAGVVTRDEVEQEIALGYLRPSLSEELESGADDAPPPGAKVERMRAVDAAAGFVKHKDAYEAKRRRLAAIREYEQRMGPK